MAAAKKPRIARLPSLRYLRRRVWQQPAGFLAVGQQSESVGRFFPEFEKQLQAMGVDLSKARSISVPQLIEDMPEKPATRK